MLREVAISSFLVKESKTLFGSWEQNYLLHVPRGRERHGMFMIHIPQTHPSRAEKKTHLKVKMHFSRVECSSQPEQRQQWTMVKVRTPRWPKS